MEHVINASIASTMYVCYLIQASKQSYEANVIMSLKMRKIRYQKFALTEVAKSQIKLSSERTSKTILNHLP